jgi:hypothetical protein
MSELYTGMDLHSGNTYVGIIEKGTTKRVFEKWVRNNLEELVWALNPYREEIRGIAVESTFNWLSPAPLMRGVILNVPPDSLRLDRAFA